MSRNDVYETDFDEASGKQPSATECPECGGTLRTDGGETTCIDCGLILEAYRIDHRGRRTFPDDPETRERTGAPLTEARHDRGLTTAIGRGTDASGNELSSRKRRQLARLRREHTRAQWQSKAERNLAHGCGEIARLVAGLDLTRDIREQASSLFRTAQREDLLPGRSIEGMAAGCVYAVCRCSGITRTLAEVVEVAQSSRTRVSNAYSVLNTELGLPTPPRQPREFIAAHASALDLPASTERRARQLADAADEQDLSNGPNPSGFAAACLSVAASEHGVEVRQTALAATADVSPATVRTHRDTLRAMVQEKSQ
jgi:transcription initiation factor TFIIB